MDRISANERLITEGGMCLCRGWDETGDKVLRELRYKLKQSCLEGWKVAARRGREHAALLAQHLYRRLALVLVSWSRHARAASFHRLAVLRSRLSHWWQKTKAERQDEESRCALADEFRLHSCAGRMGWRFGLGGG